MIVFVAALVAGVSWYTKVHSVIAASTEPRAAGLLLHLQLALSTH